MADFDNDRGDLPEESGASPNAEEDIVRPDVPEGSESPASGGPPAE